MKKAIDDMVATLKVQQADEVKKNDWCKSSIQETDNKLRSHKKILTISKIANHNKLVDNDKP